MRAGASSNRLWGAALAGGLAVLILLVFAQALRYGPVMDDDLHIFGNELVTRAKPTNVLRFWEKPHKGLYIPVAYTLWYMQARLAGLDVKDTAGGKGAADAASIQRATVLLHSVNLALHVLNAWLVFSLLRLLVAREQGSGGGGPSGQPVQAIRSLQSIRGHDVAAFLGAALFAVHPVQVEAVVWMSEFRGLLATFLCLASIRLHLMAVGRTSGGEGLRVDLYCLSFLLFILAVLSKPAAAALPLVLPVLSLLAVEAGSPGALADPLPWRRTALQVLPWLLVVLPLSYLASRLQADTLMPSITPVLLRPVVALDAIGFYLGKLIWPSGLSLDYGRSPAVVLADWQGWLGWTVPAAAAAAAWLRGGAPVRGGLLVLVLGLLPVLGLKPFLFQEFSTVADRYVYFPMLGPALVLAAAAAQLLNGPNVGAGATGRMSWARLAVPALGMLALALTAAAQVQVWETPERLYRHVLSINPKSLLALNSLGCIEADRGNLATAEGLFIRAAAEDPRYIEARVNLGQVFMLQGRYDDAARQYKGLLEMFPGHYETLLNLAAALGSLGRHNEAAVLLAEAVGRNPRDTSARFRLSVALAGAGRRQEAAAELETVLRLHPDHLEARVNLATLLKNSGDCDGAVRQFEEALAVRPGYAPVHNAIGQCLETLGRAAEAEAHFREAARLDPRYESRLVRPEISAQKQTTQPVTDGASKP